MTHSLNSGLTPVRGSIVFIEQSYPTFEKKGDNGVTIKGLRLTYLWSRADITPSSNTLEADLKEQAIKDMNTMISSGTRMSFIKDGSQSSVVVSDELVYPTWGEWGDYGDCNKDSCTHMRKKKCGESGSQVPCKENPLFPSTETHTCTSDTCRKYTS